MRLSHRTEMIEIKVGNLLMHPVLLWDDEHVVLIDTGLPQTFPALKKAIETLGFSLEQITEIILTHHDLDHMGNVMSVSERSKNIAIIAHVEEKPYMNWQKIPLKIQTYENKELSPGEQSYLEAVLSQRENHMAMEVTTVVDGEILPFCGGIQVFHTPGHTKGHISLLLEESKLLVTGDAVKVRDNKIVCGRTQYLGGHTDVEKSTLRLSQIEARAIINYHYGFFSLQD